MDEDLGIYIHVPFCARKCAYCDFNAYSGLGHLVPGFVDALCDDIFQAEAPGRPVTTIFFGGGTPTYLPPKALTRILSAIRTRFPFAPSAEISAEANPSTVDASRFEEMRAAGFNRLSIGVQALDDRLLKAVDREHSAEEAEQAVRAARKAGFTNVSIDLMIGLPGQSRSDWGKTLERAISLGTEHLSVYSLTIEPGTRFERLRAGGKLNLPAEDDELWMFEHAISRLTDAGYEHYEVSNYARPGFRARHNLTYWANGEYLGFGPGAVSYLEGRRWTKEKLPARYIALLRDRRSLVVEEERVCGQMLVAETLMLGLRLRDGVDPARVRRRHGAASLDCYGDLFRSLQSRGLMEVGSDRLRLTHGGLLLANDIFLELLP